MSEADRTESPIERKLLDAMNALSLYPLCQYQIGRYRVDFCFLEARLVVEADGKSWHQGWRAKQDNRRDAWLRENGWDVMRFTGSEIHRNARRCAMRVFRKMYGTS